MDEILKCATEMVKLLGNHGQLISLNFVDETMQYSLY